MISMCTTTPRQEQTVKTNEKQALIFVLPWLFSNMDSKVEYRFPLSFKLQCNLHVLAAL